MAILSQPRAGRAACMNCGFCLGFGCEVGAKSTSLSSVIPHGRKNRPLRNSPQLLRQSHRDRQERPRHRRRLFRRAAQHAPAKSQSRHVLRQRRGNSALAAAFRHQTVSRRARQFQRLSSARISCPTAARLATAFSTSRSTITRGSPSAASCTISTNSTRKLGLYGGGGLDARFDFTPISFALNGASSGHPEMGHRFQTCARPQFHAHDANFLPRHFAAR